MEEKSILQYFSQKYGHKFTVYPFSIKSKQNNYFFMVKNGKKKFLIVVAMLELVEKFEGSILEEKVVDENRLIIKICYLNHHNLKLLREI